MYNVHLISTSSLTEFHGKHAVLAWPAQKILLFNTRFFFLLMFKKMLFMGFGSLLTCISTVSTISVKILQYCLVMKN